MEKLKLFIMKMLLTVMFFTLSPILVSSLSIKSLLYPINYSPATRNSSKFKGVFDESLPNLSSMCPSNCSNHGQCDNKTLSCICDSDYQGSSCSTYCPRNCSNNGICAIGLGCLCSDNFEGSIK